jgi:hypothetical protein
MAGAEARDSFCDAYGPAEAVPLLQSPAARAFRNSLLRGVGDLGFAPRVPSAAADSTLHPTNEDLFVGTPAWAILDFPLTGEHGVVARRGSLALLLACGYACFLPGLKGETWAPAARRDRLRWFLNKSSESAHASRKQRVSKSAGSLRLHSFRSGAIHRGLSGRYPMNPR